MRVYLVGADLEENLGLCMIAAAAENAGHSVRILPFNEASQTEALARQIAEEKPDVLGLAIQFQHRALEFLSLARRAKQLGYAGHVTCGGQFPTMAFREVLENAWGIDSAVLYEGEHTVPDLMTALSAGTPIEEVAGLALRGPDDLAHRTAARPLENDLDALPFARHYRRPTLHLGIPFIPIMGSRGCWGRCAFCSISTVYADAKQHASGKRLRHRSPESIGEEMAQLAQAHGGSAVFCFHDDNFLMPRPADSLRRVRAIREAADRRGAGILGLIGKCRPDSLTSDLARELRALGVVRLYVGVENVSQTGSDRLGRRVRVEQVRRALEACREASIFGCYNLLLFEPGTTLGEVRENVAWIREHASHPVNFCRAEPYCGTPLQRALAAEGRLGGSYLGYDYRIADDRAELLFRVCAAAFRERNFSPAGVHNRYMGLGYYVNVLDRFYDDPLGVAAIAREAEAITRSIALETAGFLEEAIALAERGLGDPSRVEGEAALLGIRISEADRRQHARLDEVYALAQTFAQSTPRLQPLVHRPTISSRARWLAQQVSAGLFLAGFALTASGCDDRPVVVDPAVRDTGPKVFDADPLPRDAGVEATVVDMVPPDGMVADPLPPDGTVVDMVPPDGMVADPLPPDGTVVDMLPPDAGAQLAPPHSPGEELAMTGHYRDTSPRHPRRSTDLPLFDPPTVCIVGEQQGDAVLARVQGGPAAMTLRWVSEGTVEGEGREVRWRPASEDDQLTVGVRTRGGVAVVSLRKKDLA